MTLPSRHLVVAALVAALLAACGASDPAGLIASARSYLAQSNPKSAIIQAKGALQKAPDNGEARFVLAQALLASGDGASAETEARKAIDLQYAAEQVYPVLARAMLAQGKAQRVIADLADRQLTEPGARADLATSLASAYLATGDAAAAKRLAQQAMADAPDDARVLLLQADIAARAKDMAGASAFVEQALAKHPNDVEAMLFKARLLAAQGKRDDARKVLDDAIAAHPDAVEPRFAVISMLVSAGQQDQAGVQVAKLKELAPNDLRTLYSDALWSYGKGDAAHARDVLQRILGAAPEHLPSLMLSGLVQYQLGSYPAAEESLTKLLARIPGEPTATRFLASTYTHTGRAAQALELIAPIVKQGTTDPWMWRTAGEAALAAGKPSVAGEYYERAAALDQKDVGTRVKLAQVRLATGETDRAFKDLEALSTAEPAEAQADLALVAAHLRRREFDQALAAAQKLVAKKPDNAMSYNVLGTVQVSKRDLPSARASFDKALSLNPGFLEAARNLAVIDVQDGKPDAARARYDAMLAKNPKDEALLLASAELAAVAGEGSDAARKLIERAIAAQPSSPRARLALIALDMHDRDPKAALTAAQAAQSAIPRNSQIDEALGVAQMASDSANQAVETFQRIVKDNPQNAGALLRLAEAQSAAKDLPGAVVSARKAVALQPNAGPGWAVLSRLLLATNRGDEAIAEARRLQKERPGDAMGFVLEGEILGAQQKWTAATDAYRRAFAQQPYPLVAGRLYLALLRDGKAPEAAALSERWNREHPQDATLRLLAAQQAQLANDIPTAVAKYRAALEVDPDNFIVLNNLAYLLGNANDPAAREFAERAYRAAPFNPSVMDTLGTVLVANGDVQRGVQLLRMAVNVAPQDADIRLHLGKALAKSGDKAGARRELETLTRLDGKSAVRAEATKSLADL